MARNPAAFQEMLRSQDRQLSNIEVRYITQAIDVVCFAKHMGIHGKIKVIHLYIKRFWNVINAKNYVLSKL